ncbi:MAG: NADH-quinone oxidoreductase subunit NuoH [Pseudomonadota bacterium]
MDFFVRQIGMYFPALPSWIADAIWYLIVSAILLTFFALFAGPVSWLERRIAGRIMSRIGPNRVGPQGVIQWLADGLKNWLKEDLIPDSADRLLFRFAPYPVFVGVAMTLVTIPFSSLLIGADLNVGLLYIVGAWGLVVIGLLAAGWSSNNKWSLLGGMRSAAQMVSYEIPIVLSFLVVVLSSGTLSLQGIIRAQGASPLKWFVFSQPFAAIAFVIFLIAAVAEGNRTPFDIPEAESELVAGYNTEYSGMRFLFFFFAEWGNLYVVGALAAALFLGGWQIPAGLHGWAAGKWFALPHIIELAVFQAKAWIWVFLIIHIRWTLPRLRVDQLMRVSWLYLTPFAFASLIGTAVWMLLFPAGILLVSLALAGAAALFIFYFIRRVLWHMRFTKSRFDLNPII